MQPNEAIENNIKRLARGKKPTILYIGCSDSQVTAEEMLGAGPGDLLVHCNIANLIPNNDHSSNTVINFAIHDLGGKEHRGLWTPRLRRRSCGHAIKRPW